MRMSPPYLYRPTYDSCGSPRRVLYSKLRGLLPRITGSGVFSPQNRWILEAGVDLIRQPLFYSTSQIVNLHPWGGEPSPVVQANVPFWQKLSSLINPTLVP